jgi:hypothetical protein
MNEYLTVIGALVIGSIAGISFVRVLRREPEEGVDERLCVDQRADRALEQLRELSLEASHYDAAAFTQEKSRLEVEAARALQARDAIAKSKTSSRPRPRGLSDKHPMLVGAIYGGSVVAFFALLIAGLADASQQRAAVAPISAVSSTNDPRYDAVMVLSAIALEYGDAEEILKAWQLYMRQEPPRKKPPQLKRALDWLEKRVE